jgi:glycosyltransferase involved in cell wall biosynthesis
MPATVSTIQNSTVRPVAAPTVRVLHVINGEHYSGAERVQDLLALRLPEFGVEVGYAAVKPGRFVEVRESQQTPLYKLPMRSRWDWSVVKRLANLLREHDFDLLHAHTPRGALVAAMAAKQTGVPLVYHVHSPAGRDSTRCVQNWVNKQLERWALRRAEQLIAVSPSLRRLMIDTGFPAECVTCVCNGVPASKLKPKPRPEGTWKLGMIALFRPRKGTEVLLEALAILRERGFPVQLRAVGGFETPEYESEIRALVERLRVDRMIEWTGFTSNVTSELAETDLLVLPSLFGEGLPMVVLEAMAAGIPVVATDVEGVSEAVVDGVTGRLVEPGNAAALAVGIESIVHGAADYETLATAAQLRHAERFSDHAMAKQVASVYREVLRDMK